VRTLGLQQPLTSEGTQKEYTTGNSVKAHWKQTTERTSLILHMQKQELHLPAGS